MTDNSRRLDLRMFDAESSFIGDTQTPKSIKDSEGKLLDVVHAFRLQYPDLVEKEGIAIQKSKATVLDEKPGETSLGIVRALKSKKSVKLLGSSGTGKTTEISNLARLIRLGKIAKVPRTAEIRVVSLNDLGAGIKYIGTMDIKLQTLTEYARATKAILMMDEFHIISGLGVTSGNPINAGQKLKPALESGELRLIAISTQQEWNNNFGDDPAFDQRFKEIIHVEPTGEDLRTKIRNSFTMKKLPVPTNPAIERAISLSDRFAISGAQPRNAVNLLIDATERMEDLAVEGAPATVAAVEKSAVSLYRIDPAFFDPAQIRVRLSALKPSLKNAIVGQEESIDKTTELWLRKMTGVGSEEASTAILYYGPPGTGKTLMATLSSKEMGVKAYRIEMNKYANGDVEAFRYEVYQALRGSANAVIIPDELEKAHPVVQNAMLSMIQPGKFTVNFRDPGGRLIFEEVNSSNALFMATSNAGRELFASVTKGEPLGFSRVTPNSPSTRPKPAHRDVIESLVRGGISEALASRISMVVGMDRPSPEEFRSALERALNETLARESRKRTAKFVLNGKEALLDHLMRSYSEGTSDYRQVNHLLQEQVEPLISRALLRPEIAGARTVQIQWSKEIDLNELLTSENCRHLLFE